jgi:photosystem II stability/assembly factor-like uncharacterized protein
LTVFLQFIGRIAPFGIIAGLLAAAILIEPKATGLDLPELLIGPRDRFYGVATVDTGIIWLAGSDGKILRSDDDGKSWRAQATPTDLHIQDIAAWDRERAIAVGNAGLIMVTVDGGATWERVEPRIKGLMLDKLTRVTVRAGGQSLAVGEFGAVLTSDDFGRTWRLTTEQRDVGLNDVAFASATEAWVVGEFGLILRSADGGESWTELRGPSELSLNAVAFRDREVGVAVGLKGQVLLTGDGGATWREVATAIREHLFDVIWVGDSWFAAGDKGVFASGDGAGDEVQFYKPGEIDHFWHSELEARGDGIYAAGASVGVLRGGAWTRFAS